jgi:hypothetical protein
MTKKQSTKLPKALRESRDARELFTYLIRKASLSPECAMAPRHGIVRRVVLSTLGFNDRLVALLEKVPNLSLILEGLEELRLAKTGITKSGIERLRSLLPNVKVTEISNEQWATKFVADPRFNLETRQLDICDNDLETNRDIKRFFLERYGKIPRFLEKE